MIKITWIKAEWEGGNYIDEPPEGTNGTWAVLSSDGSLHEEYDTKEEAMAELVKLNRTDELSDLIANEIVSKLENTLDEIIWDAAERLYKRMEKWNNEKRETKC
jgi:hypothetical protein